MQAGDLQGAFSSLLSLSLNWLPLVVNFFKRKKLDELFWRLPASSLRVFVCLRCVRCQSQLLWNRLLASWASGHTTTLLSSTQTHPSSKHSTSLWSGECLLCLWWMTPVRPQTSILASCTFLSTQPNQLYTDLIYLFFVPFLTGKVVDIYSKFDVIVSLNIPHFLLYQILGAYCCLVVCWLCCCV